MVGANHLNLLVLKLIMLRSNRGDLTKYWMLDLSISYFQIKSRAMHFRYLPRLDSKYLTGFRDLGILGI